MKQYTNKELLDMDITMLNDSLKQTQKDFLTMRLAKGQQEKKQHHFFKLAKKQIARILTVLTQVNIKQKSEGKS